jgi:hypothetical protein
VRQCGVGQTCWRAHRIVLCVTWNSCAEAEVEAKVLPESLQWLWAEVRLVWIREATVPVSMWMDLKSS